MEVKNAEIIACSKPAQIENYKWLSDAVIIEIVHSIK